jgi:hypothetical protein
MPSPTPKRTRAAHVLLTVGLVLTGWFQTRPAPAEADTVPVSATLPATVSTDALPTWQVTGVVYSQVAVGNTVYATGAFTRARPPGVAQGGAGEIAVGNLIAYDITTGQRIASFNHTLDAQGLAVAASPDGKRVYVGGDFTVVDGKSRPHLVAFDVATGALVTTKSRRSPRPRPRSTPVASSPRSRRRRSPSPVASSPRSAPPTGRSPAGRRRPTTGTSGP